MIVVNEASDIDTLMCADLLWTFLVTVEARLGFEAFL